MIPLKTLCVTTALVTSLAIAADAPKVVLQTVMLTVVNPQGLALWAITNDAIGDDGNLDAKKLTPAKWAQLGEIGKALQAGGRTLATNRGIVAAPPGARLQDDTPTGPSKSIAVQGYLDAQPDLFHQRAKALQDLGGKAATAASKQDLNAMNQIAGDLDGVCEACHLNFWYPDQKRK
jgi:hypothetical protein